MHSGRPRKTFNFERTSSSQDSFQENLNQNRRDHQENLDENESSQVSVQESLPSARPTRAAKVICLQNISKIISEERSHDLRVLRERSQLQRAAEGSKKKEERLENLRQHASQRVACESVEQREERLQDLRHRASQRVACESAEQREQRLEDLRQRASQRVAYETNEQREHRLEEQRRREARRRRDLEMNHLPTYKCAVSADVSYYTLGPFEILCIHCGALHFPEERVSNRVNINSFGDCCSHGRIVMEPPQFSNELARLFLNRHPNSEEFHRRIRNKCIFCASIFECGR